MGLDMYLSAKLYAGPYTEPELSKAARAAIEQLPGLTIPYRDDACMESIEIELPVMYWRKANHIHAWFVNNVQDGRDECQSSDVAVEQLRALQELCAEVALAGSPAHAKEKLPCATGSFFGGTDYDEYYFEQTKETAVALGRLLAQVDAGQLKRWGFYYSASW